MTQREVLVLPDHGTLAVATAARVIDRLRAVLADRGTAHLALTGGTIGIDTLAAVGACADVGSVDWSRVHVWWSDERFLPSGDPERNETQAREALLDRLPLRPENVHPMPTPGGPWGEDVDVAAAAHAEELLDAGGGTVPAFDLLLLGMGPDGHVASLFPGFDQVHDSGVAVGVSGSPKPPPLRVSFTVPTIDAAREVWLVVSGADKAPAVLAAFGDPGEDPLPASLVHGRERTLVLLDEAAAQQLPPGLPRTSS